MANCKFENCKKKAFADEDFCTKHRAKAPTADKPVYTVVLARADGKTDVNTVFADLAESTAPESPYKKRIEHLRSSGPVRGSEESVHKIPCLHDTQPKNNVTVWYSWKDNAMTVWGLGSHSGGDGAGNNEYTMTWCDGTKKSWTRTK